MITDFSKPNKLQNVYTFELRSTARNVTIQKRKIYYTAEQIKKRNNWPTRIFEFKGKTMIISGLLLHDSHSWDIRVYHAKN